MVRIDKEWATSAIGAVSSSPLACSGLTSTRAATTEAERLKIGDFIRAALVSRCDVVHFQGAFIRRNPAQLATKFGVFKNLISQGAADITDAASTVLPNRIAASCQVFGKFRFTSSLEPLNLIRCKVLISEQQVLTTFTLHDVSIGQHAPDHVLRNLGVVLYLAAVLNSDDLQESRCSGCVATVGNLMRVGAGA